MILTKGQQEKIVKKYAKEHNTDECIAFVDGINATIGLINKLTMPVVINRTFEIKKLNDE